VSIKEKKALLHPILKEKLQQFQLHNANTERMKRVESTDQTAIDQRGEKVAQFDAYCYETIPNDAKDKASETNALIQ